MAVVTKYKCPSCGAVAEANSSAGARTLRCAHCGRLFRAMPGPAEPQLKPRKALVRLVWAISFLPGLCALAYYCAVYFNTTVPQRAITDALPLAVCGFAFVWGSYFAFQWFKRAFNPNGGTRP